MSQSHSASIEHLLSDNQDSTADLAAFFSMSATAGSPRSTSLNNVSGPVNVREFRLPISAIPPATKPDLVSPVARKSPRRPLTVDTSPRRVPKPNNDLNGDHIETHGKPIRDGIIPNTPATASPTPNKTTATPPIKQKHSRSKSTLDTVIENRKVQPFVPTTAEGGKIYIDEKKPNFLFRLFYCCCTASEPKPVSINVNHTSLNP